MSIFRFASRQTPSRRPSAPCINCEPLEQRELMTVAARPQLRAAAAQLGRPKPTQASEYASLKAATGSPKVFQDAATARSVQGLDGSGLTVAMIDTGIDYNMNALGNGFGGSHKVVAGYDFGSGDSDPMATWNHGTSTASVIGSTDAANPGIAPGADIVQLKVFDDKGNSSFTKIADALDWVIANYDKYKISVVNISISDSMNYTLNWFERDTSAGQRITDSIAKLKTLNIPVVSAAGNSFKGAQGMGFTAIVKDTISVTGVDPTTGQLASNAQRLGSTVAGDAATDIAAPSSGFNAMTGNGQYVAVDGTSFAAPIISGTILLMQQKYVQQFGSLPTVDQLNGWLKQGGSSTSDPTTGLNIPQVDLARSLALVPTKPVSPTPVVTTSPVAVNTPADTSSTVRINGQLVSTGNGSGKYSLAQLQNNAKWQNLNIWTGEAIIRRSNPTATPTPTGTLSKVMNRAQIRAKSQAHAQLRPVTTPPGRSRAKG